jgi:hypothetical protein
MSSSAQIAAWSEAWWSSLVSVSNRKEQRPDRGPVFGVCSGFVGAYIVFRRSEWLVQAILDEPTFVQAVNVGRENAGEAR